MSNDFEVHSFGNLNISELEEAKEEFLSWCDEEIQAKTQEIDLYTLTKEEFIKKYEDDDSISVPKFKGDNKEKYEALIEHFYYKN